MSQNNETAAMMVSQTSPVGVELFSYENAFSGRVGINGGESLVAELERNSPLQKL